MNDKGADEDVDAEDDDADGDDQHGEVVHGETIVEGVEDMGAGCERDISFAKKKTSQELRMLSRSLSDCKSLLLNVMI